MLTDTQIHEKIYAGFLGKAIGVRLGAPIESVLWTYDRIRATYGEITGYIRDYREFAADDDTNGPIYFIRALRDYGLQATAEDVGRTWLNYAAEGHGMYWWGGFGISTEHTAYNNLRAGIPAPQSGSIAQNGLTVAEQIGGQIFIDSWGWVNPGAPQRAAEMSAMAASVAHDGEGLNGARFCAAAIAAAFEVESVAEIVATALATLEASSTYAGVCRAVLEFHRCHPDDWRACRQMLEEDWGYDRYPGVCHIIPNAGATVLALLYGAGDLVRTVEIATMAGWDTDCNAGNAGAIIGTFQGVTADWDKYRRPINDFLVASGISGTLNIVDIPSFTRELTVLALDLAGRQVAPLWRQDMTRRGVRFDFDLPGSTHGFRVAGSNRIGLSHSTERMPEGQRGALKILLDQLNLGQGGRVFWKPFYRRADFDDERYRPMFSPLAASGQKVTMRLWFDPMEGDGNLRLTPYVRHSQSGRLEDLGGWRQLAPGQWHEMTFTLPESTEAFDEIGLRAEYFGRDQFLGALYLAEFRLEGPGQTRIEAAEEVEELGSISRFSWNRGHWSRAGAVIHGHSATDADLFTGHYYARDYAIRAEIRCPSGRAHLVTARALGTSRFYAAGFVDGEAVILREDFGTTVLATTPFAITPEQSYALTFTLEGRQLCLSVDGTPLLQVEDDTFAHGMVGLRLGSAGRIELARLEITETN
ncbi:ADP-ribosylglycohydrolase family protein [Arenibacterium sp. LLYu02]|uniref:ADP-ribosylglycohydrolase family protein n=1 Tax=Arenibacterium sp. LLYu02 TaxID=3404132 RepID=UPI003B225002